MKFIKCKVLLLRNKHIIKWMNVRIKVENNKPNDINNEQDGRKKNESN